ncbi:hypothetical protein ABIB94_007095 [Bradyrhizobium sp. JR7.2]|uniref:class I SAM-dependent methyltransferase n=1 Tax=Bradyrhizobium sp. JR7.2 TaxID=3156375 RepID=UPI00339613CF
MPELLKIDIGSGGFKRDGFVGVDNRSDVGVDVTCDLVSESLPFEDNSVGYIFSSHCFEHIPHDRLAPIFKDFSRVCADGAIIEIWNPYAFHRDGYVLGHITFLTEEIYHHVCGLQDTWGKNLGARWDLKEIRYHVRPEILAQATALGMSEDFAINHLNQVVKEFGVFIEINKARAPTPHRPLRMIVDELDHPPMRETRELNRRPVDTAVPAPKLPEPVPDPAIERELEELRRDARSWHATRRRFTSLTLQRLGLTTVPRH